MGDCPACPIAAAIPNFLASIGILLTEVTVTAAAAVTASAVSTTSYTTAAAAIVAPLPAVLPEHVWPLYDTFIESGYSTAPYQRYEFFKSEPGNSGRTLRVEYTLRRQGEGLYIKNTFYRWYDSFELLDKLGGPSGVVEMIPNLVPVKAGAAGVSKSLAVVAGKVVAAKGLGKFKFPGTNPAKAPKGFEWKGKPGSTPGSKDGNWYNPKTGESLRPDLNHPDPIGPHWDYKDPTGKWWRIFQDGSNVPK